MLEGCRDRRNSIRMEIYGKVGENLLNTLFNCNDRTQSIYSTLALILEKRRLLGMQKLPTHKRI